jgi:hypothetical protein
LGIHGFSGDRASQSVPATAWVNTWTTGPKDASSSDGAMQSWLRICSALAGSRNSPRVTEITLRPERIRTIRVAPCLVRSVAVTRQPDGKPCRSKRSLLLANRKASAAHPIQANQWTLSRFEIPAWMVISSFATVDQTMATTSTHPPRPPHSFAGRNQGSVFRSNGLLWLTRPANPGPTLRIHR